LFRLSSAAPTSQRGQQDHFRPNANYSASVQQQHLSGQQDHFRPNANSSASVQQQHLSSQPDQFRPQAICFVLVQQHLSAASQQLQNFASPLREPNSIKFAATPQRDQREFFRSCAISFAPAQLSFLCENQSPQRRSFRNPLRLISRPAPSAQAQPPRRRKLTPFTGEIPPGYFAPLQFQPPRLKPVTLGYSNNKNQIESTRTSARTRSTQPIKPMQPQAPAGVFCKPSSELPFERDQVHFAADDLRTLLWYDL
jgi:hypothetical protein